MVHSIHLRWFSVMLLLRLYMLHIKIVFISKIEYAFLAHYCTKPPNCFDQFFHCNCLGNSFYIKTEAGATQTYIFALSTKKLNSHWNVLISTFAAEDQKCFHFLEMYDSKHNKGQVNCCEVPSSVCILRDIMFIIDGRIIRGSSRIMWSFEKSKPIFYDTEIALAHQNSNLRLFGINNNI